MAIAPVTRRTLGRAVIRNAATKPVNVAVPVAVAVAGFVFAWWLVPLALVVYAALVVATVFDGDAAERVGTDVYAKRKLPRAAGELPFLAPAVSEKLGAARDQERRIQKSIDASPVALVDVAGEVQRLMESLETLARHADRVAGYLAEEDEDAVRERLERLRAIQSGDETADRANTQAADALQDQLDARAQLARQLARFEAQMEHIAATLGVIHAQIVRMSVEEGASEQGRIAEQVRDLRLEIGATADAMQEAYGELG